MFRIYVSDTTCLAAVAILDLVLVVLPSQPSYYLTPSETLAKFYSNSMMVVLNSRMRIGVDPGLEGGNNSTTARIRTGGTTAATRTMDTDAYELGDGVVVTREQVVFPNGKESGIGQKGYLV